MTLFPRFKICASFLILPLLLLTFLTNGQTPLESSKKIDRFIERVNDRGLDIKNPEISLAEIDQFIEVARSNQLKEKELDLLTLKASLYQLIGKRGNARRLYESLLERKSESPTFQIQILNQIGVINDQTGNPKEARSYYKRAIQLLEKLNNAQLLYEIHNNLAVSYDLDKKYDLALKHFALAEGNLETDNYFEAAIILAGRATTYRHKKDFNNSFKTLIQALNNSKINENLVPTGLTAYVLIELVETIDQLGVLTQEQSKTIEALGGVDGLLRQAYGAFKEGGIADQYSETYTTLARICAENGDYEKAFEIANKNTSVMENNFNENQQRVFAEMETKYQTREKLANSERVREREKLQGEAKLIKVWLNFLVALSVFLIVLTVLIRNWFIRRREAMLNVQRNEYLEKMLSVEKENSELIRDDLENKRRDLTNFSLRAARERTWIEDLNKLSKRVKKGAVKNLESELLLISTDMNDNLLYDEQYQLLNNQTKVLGNAFVNKLAEFYPALTKTEVELCKLIRLGMSNIEIARVRTISKESARKARYRLRNKLNLDESANMESFLVNL